jgi:hypothetical protein
MSISKVLLAREALFAFRMFLPWLKNLFTAACTGGDLRSEFDEELGEEFPPISQCASPFPIGACVMVPNIYPLDSCFF